MENKSHTVVEITLYLDDFYQYSAHGKGGLNIWYKIIHGAHVPQTTHLQQAPPLPFSEVVPTYAGTRGTPKITICGMAQLKCPGVSVYSRLLKNLKAR